MSTLRGISRVSRLGGVVFLTLAACSHFAGAQVCLMGTDMDESTRSVLQSTAQRYFEMAVRGDAQSLRQNAISSLASNFSGIESAVKDNQSNLAGAQATSRAPFLLKAEGTAPLPRAEFLCGVFGATGQTTNSAVFVIPNLPPGNYAIATLDVTTAKVPHTASFVLKQEGSAWKLGGYYVKPSKIGGHDGQWFAEQARQFKAKGQTRNAWLYQLQARDLLVPVPFMSTLATDKLYDEFEKSKPPDLPPFDLPAGAKTFKVTHLFPYSLGNDLDLVVRYSTASIADSGQAFQDNVAVMKALVAKYPEFRDGFNGVVARAVEPSGRDYGTLLQMQNIK